MKRIVAVLIVVSWCITAGAAPQQNPDAEGARRDFPVPADVTVVRDLVYADYGTRRLKLDVYLPPRTDPRVAAPGVLVVRGGGWRVGALGADANARSISSASPVTFVSRRSAPLLLLHSPTDPVVPFAL